MKKLLALLLSALLLLSTCALAEEVAPVDHSYRLSNVYIIFGDQVIDLSSLFLELDASGAEEPDACCLHLNSEEGSVAEIGLAALDDEFIIHLNSESLGHVDYAVDPVVLIAKVLDRGVEGLVQMLQSLDTTDMAQGIVNAIDSIASRPLPTEAPAETPAPAESQSIELPPLQLPQISIEGDLAATLLGCLSDPETVELGGVDYAPNGSEIIIADGSYTSQEFTIDTETLCTILNMVHLNGEPSGWGDMVRETGISFEVHGSFQTGEEEGLNQIASLTATLDTGDAQQVLNLHLNTFYDENGETTAVSYGQTVGDQGIGLSLYLSKGQHEGEPFTSASIDRDSAIVLSDMELEEAFGTLGQSLSTMGQDALNALIAPLLQMAYADADAAE